MYSYLYEDPFILVVYEKGMKLDRCVEMFVKVGRLNAKLTMAVEADSTKKSKYDS